MLLEYHGQFAECDDAVESVAAEGGMELPEGIYFGRELVFRFRKKVQVLFKHVIVSGERVFGGLPAWQHWFVNFLYRVEHLEHRKVLMFFQCLRNILVRLHDAWLWVAHLVVRFLPENLGIERSQLLRLDLLKIRLLHLYQTLYCFVVVLEFVVHQDGDVRTTFLGKLDVAHNQFFERWQA